MIDQNMTTKDTRLIKSVLSFWFEEISPENWFKKDAEFDRILKEQFEPLIKAGLSGQLDRWAADADGRLALILLLDQMTRNIYRDSPAAFSGDEMALALSLRAQSDNMIASQK